MKYEQIISERMRERQVERGRNQADYLNNSKSRPNEPLLDKTSKRKELAKIANTSEGSIQRTKYILENGTEEQIERARKGVQFWTYLLISNFSKVEFPTIGYIFFKIFD